MNQFIITSAVLGILSYILMDPKLAQSEFLRRKSSSWLLIGESIFIFPLFYPLSFLAADLYSVDHGNRGIRWFFLP